MPVNILLCKTREAFSDRKSNISILSALKNTAPAVIPPYMAALSLTPRAQSPPLEFEKLEVVHEAL